VSYPIFHSALNDIKKNLRWEETDVPWQDLDDDGMTEPEEEFDDDET
jgi:hypothetical protein